MAEERWSRLVNTHYMEGYRQCSVAGASSATLEPHRFIHSVAGRVDV